MLPVQFSMFPSDDVNYFSISIKEEPGSNTLKTEKISKEIEFKL
jgi:multidrug efflux pump subunit AcrB